LKLIQANEPAIRETGDLSASFHSAQDEKRGWNYMQLIYEHIALGGRGMKM